MSSIRDRATTLLTRLSPPGGARFSARLVVGAIALLMIGNLTGFLLFQVQSQRTEQVAAPVADLCRDGGRAGGAATSIDLRERGACDAATDTTQVGPYVSTIAGPTGPAGETGAAGEPGRPGPQGISGRPGVGIPGAPGTPGADSTVPGPQGERGAPGADSQVPGPRGKQGTPGADSTVPGPRGAQGQPGADSTVPGPRGPQGEPGEQGPPGPVCPEGSSAQSYTFPDGVPGFRCVSGSADG